MAKGKKITAMAGMAMPVDGNDANDAYETEQDLQACARARACENDPARMKKVKALAKSKLGDSNKKKAEAQHLIDMGKG